jgi:hypothetical protein
VDDARAEALREFHDQDLRILNQGEQARLKTLLAELPLLADPRGEPWPTRPWYLWKHQLADGTPILILFESCSTPRIPGPAIATVRFLDRAGRQLEGIPFYAGWRCFLDRAEIRQDETFGTIIEIHHWPDSDKRTIRRQTYAVDGNRLALLRVEDGSGRSVYNSYGHPAWRKGPAPPDRSAGEWGRALGGSPALALEALVWLGGNHKPEVNDPTFPGAEDAAAIRHIEDMRRDARVRAAVRQLATHAHPWVREAAAEAVRREDE